MSNNADIPMASIATQTTGIFHYNSPTLPISSTNPWAPIPKASLDITSHAERMNEFLQRQARPPPFPTDLPARPASKKRINPWIWASVILFGLLVGVSVSSVVLFAKNLTLRKDAQARNGTITTTIHHTMAEVHTLTTIETSVSTLTTFDPTLSIPSVIYVTNTITAAPETSGLEAGNANGEAKSPSSVASFTAPLRPTETASTVIGTGGGSSFTCVCTNDFCKANEDKCMGATKITEEEEGCCRGCGCYK
jgi:hypothetical protein